MPIPVGLNLGPDPALIDTIRPLVADHLVDAVEWDLDSPWVVGARERASPGWFERLLDLYAADGRLYGHGVWLSILSARAEPRQTAWLDRLAGECARRPYRHVSEHLGFMSAGPVAVGTLLPVPRVDAAVAVGRSCLARLAAATGARVGLENLAATLSPDDATAQASLLGDLLSPVDGFILLDLHNVFTQAVNLGLDPLALLETFPPDRVRELHVSGGRWANLGGQRCRFDGHNGPVPDDVFPLVAAAIARLPNVEVVIFERRLGTIESPADVEETRADYRRLVETVRAAEAGVLRPGATALRQSGASQPAAATVPRDAMTDPDSLAAYQEALLAILRGAAAPPGAIRDALLEHPAAAAVRPYVASFASLALAQAAFLARRWSTTEQELATTGLRPKA